MTSLVEELRRLKKEEPKQIYWLCSNNSYLEKELIKTIAGKISADSSAIEKLDLSDTDINDFAFLISSGSLLTGGKVVLVDGAIKVKAEKGKQVTESLASINSSNIVIFTEEGISGATTLGKFLNSNSCVIKESGLDDKMILSWAKKRFESSGCEADSEAISMLVERTLGDLTMLAQEIDKIVFFVGDAKKVTASDVKETVKEKTEVVIFQVLDELAAKQTAKGIRLLHKLARDGEPPERMVVMLYNHFLRVLAAQAMVAQKATQAEVAKQLACHPFVAKKAMQTASSFTKEELLRYLEQINNAEISFKTGSAKALEAIETALFQIVR